MTEQARRASLEEESAHADRGVRDFGQRPAQATADADGQRRRGGDPRPGATTGEAIDRATAAVGQDDRRR